MNYEKDIRIDETALDVEWLEQPKLFMKYAKHSARMAQELEREKEKLDLVRAGLDKEIRTDPEKFGIAKITETAVSNTIISHPEYKEANESYLEMKYEYDIARSAVNAMNMRKEALENLVRLHGMQYFAGPKIPRDLSQEKARREEQQKQIDGGVASKMKLKRNR